MEFKMVQELLYRTHGQNQGGRWKQGTEVDLDGGGRKCRQL